MTSNNLSTKQTDKQTNKATKQTHEKKRSGSLLRHGLKSHWWLFVISLVVYAFAGPVYTLLRIDNITKPSYNNYLAASSEEALLAEHLQQMVHWLSTEGMMMYYIAAVVLAAVIGCVMFFYLQQKRQVNFYHSQPITRTRLFCSQYGIGLAVNVVPMLLMMAVSFLIVLAYGFGAALSLGAILQNIAYLLLFILASYSIAVFSAQLAGTILTQIALNAVLHFGIPAGAVVLNWMFELFFGTYTGETYLIQSALKFSPFCAMLEYLSSVSYVIYADTMVTEPMTVGNLAAQVVIAVLLTALACFLYQKRPSEVAGKALVYSYSEPILKAYLMFVVAITAGVVFMLIGSNTFFYFAVVVFAVLTHMACEVIIQHDFKAMVRRMPQCAIILVLILGSVAVFRFDLLGYDDYLPEPEKVERTALWMSGAEVYSDYDFEPEYIRLGSADPNVKQAVYDLLLPVIEEDLHAQGEFNRSNMNDYDGRRSRVEVNYTLSNGKTVNRQYNSVPVERIEAAYEQLYNQQSFRDDLYSPILQMTKDDIRGLEIDQEEIYNPIGTKLVSVIYTADAAISEYNAVEREMNTPEAHEQAWQIMQAFQQDLRDRQFSDLQQPVAHRMCLYIPRDEGSYRSAIWEVNMTILPTDERTVALLNQLNIAPEWQYSNYSDALIFRMEDGKTAQDVAEKISQEIFDTEKEFTWCADDYVQYLTNEADCTLTGRINGVEAVKEFLRQNTIMSDSGIFARYEERYLILLRYNNTEREEWTTQSVYLGRLPEQYR